MGRSLALVALAALILTVAAMVVLRPTGEAPEAPGVVPDHRCERQDPFADLAELTEADEDDIWTEGPNSPPAGPHLTPPSSRQRGPRRPPSPG